MLPDKQKTEMFFWGGRGIHNTVRVKLISHAVSILSYIEPYSVHPTLVFVQCLVSRALPLTSNTRAKCRLLFMQNHILGYMDCKQFDKLVC